MCENPALRVRGATLELVITALSLFCEKSFSGVSPMLGFKRFFNARRVLAGVELVHNIIKGQFGLPESFGTDPFHVCNNVLAA